MSQTLADLVKSLLADVAACKAAAEQLDLQLQNSLPNSNTSTPLYVPPSVRHAVRRSIPTFGMAPARSMSPEPVESGHDLRNPHVALQLRDLLSPSPLPKSRSPSRLPRKRDASELSTPDEGKGGSVSKDSSRSTTPVEVKFQRVREQRLNGEL